MGERKEIIIESDEINATIWIMTHLPEIRNWGLIEWEKFEKSLLYKDRFSADNVFLDAIKEYQEKATKVFNKGTVFYRARVFHQEPIDRFLHFMRKEMKGRGENISDFLKGVGNIPVDTWLSRLSKMNETVPFVAQAKQALRAFQKARFKGYGPKESTAPPADRCTSYRANPDHIRYLYLSEDQETPIYEIRSALSQCISIAKLKCKRPLKVYDLTVESRALSTVTSATIKSNCAITYVCGVFSLPNHSDPSKYLPTQYIAEMIKHMGFDGIRYLSALHEGGYNVVLFDPDDCTVISSDLLEINNIHIETEKPSIYTVDS